MSPSHAQPTGSHLIDGSGDTVIMTAVFSDWESLQTLVASLERVLVDAGLHARVLVVDDGSPVFADLNLCAMLNLSAITEIRLVTLTRNLGQQGAVAVGLGYIAAEMPCDYLVIMDSDMEDRPEDILPLLSTAQKAGNAIVFAERTRRSEGLVFRVFYRIYQNLYRMLTGTPISVGNFTVIPGRLIRRVAAVSEIWNHFAAGVMRARIPFQMVPTARGERIHGKSKMNFVALVIHGLSGLAVHADTVAVRAVLGILILAILSIIVMAAIIVTRLFGGIETIGWTSQTVLLLGGLLFQGVVAAGLIVFLVLAGRTQRSIIPAQDYRQFILETGQMNLSEQTTPSGDVGQA